VKVFRKKVAMVCVLGVGLLTAVDGSRAGGWRRSRLPDYATEQHGKVRRESVGADCGEL